MLGKQVRLEGLIGARSATVVGVLEPSVPYPVATEIIANVVTSPHHLSATMVTGREHRMTEVFARLAPGATVEQARSELRTVYGAMTAAHPEVYKPGDHYAIEVTRMHDQINSRANTILWVLFAAAASAVCDCELECGQPGAGADGAARVGAGGADGAGREHGGCSAVAAGGGPGTVRERCDRGVVLAVPMVSELGRYASRFSVRAEWI